MHPLRLSRASLATPALLPMHVLIGEPPPTVPSSMHHVAELPARGVRGPMPADPEAKGRRQPGVSFTRGDSHPQAQPEHFSFLLSLRSVGASVRVQTLFLPANKFMAVFCQRSTFQRLSASPRMQRCFGCDIPEVRGYSQPSTFNAHDPHSHGSEQHARRSRRCLLPGPPLSCPETALLLPSHLP